MTKANEMRKLHERPDYIKARQRSEAAFKGHATRKDNKIDAMYKQILAEIERVTQGKDGMTFLEVTAMPDPVSDSQKSGILLVKDTLDFEIIGEVIGRLRGEEFTVEEIPDTSMGHGGQFSETYRISW